jgi:hypothetical protein
MHHRSVLNHRSRVGDLHRVHSDSADFAVVAVRAVAALVIMKLDVLVVLVVGVEDEVGGMVESSAGCNSTGLGLSDGNCSRR